MSELSQLVRTGLHSCQVCVPAGYTDAQVVGFAVRKAPLAGGPKDWVLSPPPAAWGRSARIPCAVRAGFVHIALVAGR